MGFVRHDQIKRGDGRVGLGCGDDSRRLVGGENHAVACAAEKAFYFVRIRGNGKGQVGHAVDGFVVASGADGLIRADAQHFKLDGGGKCPFAQELGQQPQGRNQHQSALRVQMFLDPQRDVSFARAASHDELATVGSLQPLHHGGSGFVLVVARFGTSFAFDLRECGKVGGIIQRGFIKVGQQKTHDGFFLRVADLLGIRADAVGGSDQQAVLDLWPVRFAEEFIYIVFGDVVIERIALGLHRPVVAVLVPKHQINAAVRAPASRPFIPQPHLVNLRRPFGISFEEPFDEVLELLAAFERVGIEADVEVGELGSHFSHNYSQRKMRIV